jgi:hypothetical protein
MLKNKNTTITVLKEFTPTKGKTYFENMTGKVFISIRKLFNLYFAEEIKIVENITSVTYRRVKII